MRELQLDGIHDDGDHVVLTDSDGEQYTLRIDEALRAAVRRDRPALGMIQSAAQGPLRPREIQAMLRGGRDAEEIARIADIDVEHVRRYEGPVLAERGYIAERARAFAVGRGGGPTLDELVTRRLRARQAAEGARWDAWRNDDGTWTVELAFEAGGRTREAHWNVDMTRQAIVADDDEARWLTDDDAPGTDEPRSRVRLAAVKGRVYDVEADGGVEVEQPSPAPLGGTPRTARDEHPAAIDEDELDALNARRGLRSVPARATEPQDTGQLGTSLWSSISDASDDEALREHARERSPEDEHLDRDDEDALEQTGIEDTGTEPAAGTEGPSTVEEGPGSLELTPLPGFDEAPSAPEPTRRRPRAKRSSIPSWDEIVFGSKNQD